MIKRIYKYLVPESRRISLREAVMRLTAPLYFGNRFSCNCCNRSFRKFIPKGHIYRPNAQCPSCMSLERTRVLDLFLNRELGVFDKNGLKILHFAPEKALVKKLSKIPGVEYVDADINPAFAGNVIDIESIPFEDEYFDLIVCSHVLGHVKDEAAAVNEMYRVIKPGGLAIVMTLLSDRVYTFEDPAIKTVEERLQNYGEVDLQRLHGLDFSSRLEKGGFSVEEIDYREKFSPEIQLKYALGDGAREKIFKCTKGQPVISRPAS